MPPPLTMQPAPTKRLAPLLVLCPLLAVSDSVINALGLGVITIVVTVVASLPLTVTLQSLSEYGRIAAAVAIIAAVITGTLLLSNAYFHDLYLAVGVYLPLLIAGGLLIARHDVAAPRERHGALILAGLRTGALFALTLLTLGAAREFVGRGSLFFGVDALPIAGASILEGRFFHPDMGFVLAALPPGAFIAMGVLFAARNWYRLKTQS